MFSTSKLDMKSISLHQLTYRLCPKGGVPILEVFLKDIIFALMQKNGRICATYINDMHFSCFHLWSLEVKRPNDVFVVILNFISNNWEPKHIAIKLFDHVNDTSSVTMTCKL